MDQETEKQFFSRFQSDFDQLKEVPRSSSQTDQPSRDFKIKNQGRKIDATSPESIVEMVEAIFTDSYLYRNPKFRVLVQEDPKGYVNIKDLINEKIFQEYLHKFPGLHIDPQIIAKQIRHESKKLVCRNGRIKRIVPFDNKIDKKQSKLIFIQGFPDQLPFMEVLKTLEQFICIEDSYFPHNQVGWGLIYTHNWRDLLKLNDCTQIWQNHNLKVKNPDESMDIYFSLEKYGIEYKMLDICKKREKNYAQRDKDQDQFLSVLVNHQQCQKILRQGRLENQEIEILHRPARVSMHEFEGKIMLENQLNAKIHAENQHKMRNLDNYVLFSLRESSQ